MDGRVRVRWPGTSGENRGKIPMDHMPPLVDHGWSWLMMVDYGWVLRDTKQCSGRRFLFPEMDGDMAMIPIIHTVSQRVLVNAWFMNQFLATYRGMWEIYGNMSLNTNFSKWHWSFPPWPLTSHNRCQDLRKVWTNLRTSAAGISCRQPGWVRAEMGSHQILPVAFSILGMFGGVLNCIAKGCQIKRIFVAKRWCLNPRHRFWAQILTRILPKRHDGRQMVGSIVRSRWFRINANPD